MTAKVLVPPIKSQGIKTKLVPWISRMVAGSDHKYWLEPFMGTGVVGLNLASTQADLSDANPHIINFYQSIANGDLDEHRAAAYLYEEGARLRERGEKHYYEIRARFNEQHEPLDFLFLNRAGFNGMMRFNRKGGFNVPFCRKPERFAQAYRTKIVNQIKWVRLKLESQNFSFRHEGFSDAIGRADEDTLIYCDPPYIDRHADYYNGWNEEDELSLYSTLKKSKANFILSTWHHNDFRENKYIEELWSDFRIYTREHFYHVGASEKNRSPMIEALVTNLDYDLIDGSSPSQLELV